MGNELIFRIIFIAILVPTVGMRLYFHIKAGTFHKSYVSKREGNLIGPFRSFLAIAWTIVVLIYMIYPPAMDWSAVTLPFWSRWIGSALGVLACLMLYWVHYALGQNYSPTLRTKEEHTLITHGPYRWIRHPMYTALLLIMIASFLITANWSIGIIGVVKIILTMMMARTPKEEAMLLEKFGDQYRQYMAQTGRFFPLLIKK